MPGRDTSVIDTGLRGRVALVTGGNHGVGAATARGFIVRAFTSGAVKG